MNKSIHKLTSAQQHERDAFLQFVRYNFNNQRFEKTKVPKYSGGSARYKDLNVFDLKKLIDLGYMDVNDKQNNAPTTKEFLLFMEKNPFFLAHGYAVKGDREDCRVVIEGLEHHGSIKKETLKNDFLKLFHDADDLVFYDDFQYCWYD